MSALPCRKGAVVVTALVMTGVCALVLGGVLSYVSYATRATAVYVGDNACRLAAQSEIELAKAAINDEFNRSIARGAHIIGGTMGSTVCSFDWFGVGDSTAVRRNIGAQNGRGTSVTLDESVTNGPCTVRVRVGRINHPANAQWADVTIVAEAVRPNPGGTESRQIVAETVRFAQQRSKVFNNAYFVNNYGWFQGTGCTANGDVRANGDMYLDSGCKINGGVYAARNEELGVYGDITNYGTMDSYSTYRSSTYGVSNMARPLARDPVTGDVVAGGYVAPDSATTQAKQSRIHANEERETEMPFIGDLTSENSDYRQWIEELRASDPSLCKVTQGGQVLVDKYYDGVGPSGDASLADNGVLILEGTQSNPIKVNGPVVVKSDVIIKGYVTGQGTIYSGRNVHIVGNIQYVNPPSWSGKRANEDNSTKDMLGLMAKGNIVMGDYTESSWLSSIRTYLTSQPYVQRYKCDSTDDLIGYPETFGGSYAATEKVTQMGSASDADHAPGGWNPSTGQFGKVREVELGTTHTETTQTWDSWRRKWVTTTTEVPDIGLATVYDRKYYESVANDDEISSRCSTITRIDAVLYNNHGIFGKLGECSINGSLVCRNEGLQYSRKLYLNWDIRLYSGSSETVDNNQVGLAKASDSPPTTLDWCILPPGVVDFDAADGEGGD
ncbi:MAG: hypothetical protein J6T01_00470 [Kiritimatiellae bacterium]|nr:hypothetical protein [Kiritimatiellia bacterium]